MAPVSTDSKGETAASQVLKKQNLADQKHLSEVFESSTTIYSEGEEEFEMFDTDGGKTIGEADNAFPWDVHAKLAKVIRYAPRGGVEAKAGDDMLGVSESARYTAENSNVADLREYPTRFTSLGNDKGVIILSFAQPVRVKKNTVLQIAESSYDIEASFESAYEAWNTYPEKAAVYVSNNASLSLGNNLDDNSEWQFIGYAHVGNNMFALPKRVTSFRMVKIVDAGSLTPDGFDLNFVATYRAHSPVVLPRSQTELQCRVTENSFAPTVVKDEYQILDNVLKYQIPTSADVIDLFMFNEYEQTQFKRGRNPVVGTFIALLDGRLHGYEIHKDCSVTGFKKQEWGTGAEMHNASLISQPASGDHETEFVYGVGNGYTYEWLGWVTSNGWVYNMSYRIIELDQEFIVPLKRITGGRLEYTSAEAFSPCEHIPLTPSSLRIEKSSHKTERGKPVRAWVDRYKGCSEENNGYEVYNIEEPTTQYHWITPSGKVVARGRVAYLMPKKTTRYTLVAIDSKTGRKAQSFLKIWVKG